MDTNGEGCDVNMSLVMAIANQNGIVVSGDWRAMKYWLQPDGGDPIFVRSIDRFQKIYRTKSNHCIGFCGHTKLDNGKELGEILQKIIEVFDKSFISYLKHSHKMPLKTILLLWLLDTRTTNLK